MWSVSNAIAGFFVATVAATSWQQSAARSQRLFALSSATIKPVNLISCVLAFFFSFYSCFCHRWRDEDYDVTKCYWKCWSIASYLNLHCFNGQSSLVSCFVAKTVTNKDTKTFVTCRLSDNDSDDIFLPYICEILQVHSRLRNAYYPVLSFSLSMTA